MDNQSPVKRSTFVEPQYTYPVVLPDQSEVWSRAPEPINVDGAFMAQAAPSQRMSGWDRSAALLLRLAPLAILWFMTGLLCAVIAKWMIEVDEITSASIGLAVFIYLSYRSYDQADKRERHDSPSGVEHHRIKAAKDLAALKLEYDQKFREMASETIIKQLEARGDDYQ